MIDNIKVKISNLDKGLRSNKHLCFQGVSFKSEVYRLYNCEGREDGAYLLLKYNREPHTLTMENSIRKWFYGRYSIKDLDRSDFIKAYNKIADILGIEKETLYKASFTQCEIGLNDKTKIPPGNIVPLVAAYSSLKRMQIENETVEFKGTDLRLIMYDKTKEILDKRKKNSRRLPELDNNLLRIEFKLSDRQAFVNKGLSHIKTVGDIAEHYRDIRYFWINELNRVVIFNKLIFSEKMSMKQYLIAQELQREGYGTYIYNCSTRENPQSKSRYTNEANKVIRDFSDPKEYNMTKFKIDAFISFKKNVASEKGLNMRNVVLSLFAKRAA